jgi:cholesterol transport system auxiliary component
MNASRFLNILKTSHVLRRWKEHAFVAFLLASVCGWSGCVTRPSLNIQTFSFNAPAIPATNVVANDRVLGIRNLQIAPPFDGRSLVYRTGEFSYVRDPYAEFLGLPAEELMAPVRGWLREGGGFSAVVDAGSAVKPNTLVEISVTQLFGDFRRPEHSAAVIRVRFVFFDATNGIAGRAILQREYTRSIPLSAPTAAALMQGWNQGLAEILAEVASDLQHSETGDSTAAR